MIYLKYKTKKVQKLKIISNLIKESLISRNFSILEVPSLNFPKFSPADFIVGDVDRINEISEKIKMEEPQTNRTIQEIIDSNFITIIIKLLDFSNLPFLQYTAARFLKLLAKDKILEIMNEYSQMMIRNGAVTSLLNILQTSNFVQIQFQVFIFFFF